ncbi:MAG: glycosyltransferase family 2 protein [Anaerolineales bacterium]|nr:glycosyltransferase family 2 protein [Anaerolineales bacterium]
MKEYIINQEIPAIASPSVEVSLVIPVYNEEDNVPLLHRAIHEALDGQSFTWEVIYVDDGSQDNTAKKLEKIAEVDPGFTRVISLRRNFGQTAATSAGIDYARGGIIVLMDGDLQNDPDDIPMMLKKIDEGYDLVSGWRINRQDTFLTRTLPSRIANFLISRVTGVYLHDYGCTLKAYRREVLTGFRLYGEMHRFIPAYAGMVGAKIIEVPVKHHPRKYGKAKYGLERTIKVVLDLFTVRFLLAFSNKPIYLFGTTGIGMMGLGTLGVIFLILRKWFFQGGIADSPIFLGSVMLFLMGFQSMLMGLIAEMVVRTYHESQQKPIYKVRFIIDGDKKSDGR